MSITTEALGVTKTNQNSGQCKRKEQAQDRALKSDKVSG